jgi:sensor histidine kinase YesM
LQLQAKERSISRLNDQVGVSESKLKQNRLLLIIAALSALLGITIAVLFYVIMKQRKIRQEKDKIKFQRNAIDLEQRLLRTQIEPHFIFNTLAALQSYIRLDEKDKSLKFLSQFSKLLRNSLEISREHLVPLSQEADVLENYLSLQQMRYEDSFTYQLLLPSADISAEVLIPPMLIQPFVENAIIHGVNQVQEKGLIKIEMIVQQEYLLVQITDNGPGLEATAHKKTQNKSLSTAISRERLAIIANEMQRKAGIKLADRKQMNPPAQGTFVEIIIPI